MSEKEFNEQNLLMNKIFKFLLYALAFLGVVFVCFLIRVYTYFFSYNSSRIEMPNQVILTVNMSKEYYELREDDLIKELSGTKKLSFFDLNRTILISASDPKVKALVLNISDTQIGLAQTQTLMRTIETFKTSGKKVYTHSKGFGNFGGGIGAYYLASASDEIWIMPNNEIGITGIGIEVPFFKDLFDKIGVKPEFFSRYEYKNAMESYMSNSFSKEQKEEMKKLTNSIYSTIAAEVIKQRKLDNIQNFNCLVNNAPLYISDSIPNFSSDKKLMCISDIMQYKYKLIDGIAYQEDFIQKLEKDYNAEAFSISDYSLFYSDGEDENKVVAYLTLEGVIDSGRSQYSSITGESVIGSETVIKQIREISEDERVYGLIVRIDSPGGSYVASNEIYHALMKLKEEKKIPIIISMGNYAASGGYFIALAGDWIFAEPSTITGSIGVFGGKYSLQKLWKKIGINWEMVKIGENAGISSINKDFTPREIEIFNASLDNIYNDFTKKVSESRKISLKELDKLARGRVWTGEQALGNGLIDEIGGFFEANSKLNEVSALKPEEKTGFLYYPKSKTTQELISDFFNEEEASIKAKKISANLLKLGIDIRDINMLKRMQYDVIMPPMKISK